MYGAKLHCQHANPKNCQHFTNKLFHYKHELKVMGIEQGAMNIVLSNFQLHFPILPTPLTLP